jgi:hypothetical protein
VLHVLTLDNPHKEITIRASGIVDIADEGDEMWRKRSCCRRWFSALYAANPRRRPIREFAQRLYRPMRGGEPESTDGGSAAENAILTGRHPGAGLRRRRLCRAKGVCQDHTHVFLACCRALEIPARYVSGYVYSDNAQHVAMHAWAEVWLDGAGSRLISPIIPVA